MKLKNLLKPLAPFLLILALLGLPFLTFAGLQVKVYLQPSSLEVSPGDTFEVKVYVDPMGFGVSAGDFQVAYSSKVFKALDVEVGEFFGKNPLIAVKKVEVKDEKEIVRLAVARVGKTVKPIPSGVALTLKLMVLKTALSGSYPIEVLKVSLVDESFNRITNLETQGCTITVKTSPKEVLKPTPTPSKPSPPTPTPSKVTVLVLDEVNGKPLAGVKVEVDGNRVLTGVDGKAVFTLKKGTYTITASTAGYMQKSVTVTVGVGEIRQVELRLKPLKKPGGGCLIATAAYGSEFSPQVQMLRDFRDHYVLATHGGFYFMKVFNVWYYSWSPAVAELERSNPTLRFTVKNLIYPLLVELEASKTVYLTLKGFNSEVAIVAAGFLASMLIGVTYFTIPTLPVYVLLERRGIKSVRLKPALTTLPLSIFVVLHWLGLKTAGWILSLTSVGIVLSTIALTVFLMLKMLTLPLKRKV